jgi:ubiquinol-cytochrome c reductase cytochrome b subunit
VRTILARASRRRVHLTWTSLFGVVTVTCLVVLALTGVLLSFDYTASSDVVTYDGPYDPVVGAQVSRAYDSTMTISLERPGGMLVRQTHHWAALVLPASIILQLLAAFFTGAFRRPRRTAWVLLVLLFVVALVGGWSGYALPDDMLSGTGLRIVEGVVMAIPVVGTRLSTWMFGGRFPGEIIEHLYPVHVLIVPVLAAVVVTARAVLAWTHGSPTPPRAALLRRQTLGIPLWPDAAVRAVGMSAITAGVLVLLGGTSTVSPIWGYGPTAAGNVGAGSQPDWYMGFLDGALRLVPPGWETEWLGYTWTFAVLVPLVVVGAWFALLIAYPYVESWVTRDTVEHDVLDRPRNVPVRTGFGVAGALFYGVLWAAASADIMSTQLHVSFESVIRLLQVVLVAGPPLAFEVTRRVCHGLQLKDRAVVDHGHETGRIVRTAAGEYLEIHVPASPAERRALAVAPVPARPPAPDAARRRPALERVRTALARQYAAGHVAPEEREPDLVAGASEGAASPAQRR